LSDRGYEINIVTINRYQQYKLEIILSILYLKPRLKFPDKFRLSVWEIYESIGKSKLFEVKSLKEMKKYLNNVDIIYSKNEILDLSILNLLKDGNTPPIVTGLHTALYYPVANSIYSKFHNAIYSSRFYSSLLKMCSAIHTVNTDQKDFLVRIHQIEPNKIYFIPYWIEIDNEMIKERFKKLSSTSNNYFNILFAGRLTEQKGIDILCEIINKINRRINSNSIDSNKVIFHIAGSGEFDWKIEKLSKRYPNIKYYGHVSQKRMKELYQISDLVIVPSRWETVSYVCLEAQSFGIPVIASRVSGPKDIVIDGKTGYLIEPNDVDSFVNAILYIYKNKDTEIYIRMCKESIENINKRFSKQVIIPKMMTLLKKITTQT